MNLLYETRRNWVLGTILAAVMALSLVGIAPPATAAPRVLVVERNGAAGTYSTIQSAINASIAGDTVMVRDGTYNEHVKITKGGSASAPVVLTASSDQAVLRGTISITAAHVTVTELSLQGMNADGTVQTASAVKVEAKHAKLSGLTIQNFRGWAIEFAIGPPDDRQKASHGVATDNYIYNCFAGINAMGETLVENNEIERLNRHGSVAPLGDAFRVFGSNTTIRGNYVHGSSANELEPVHSDMIQSWDDNRTTTKNVLIENNIFTGWYHQGIMLENDAFGRQGQYYIADWTVRNNVFAGARSWGVLAGKINGGIPNMRVDNNVFVAHEGGGYMGVGFVGKGGTGTVRNNILSGFSDLSYSATDAAKFTASHNLVHNSPAPPAPVASDILNSDPLFVNSAASDFTLKSGSPAIDSGTDAVDLPVDSLGNARAGVTDIGAFEYHEPGPTQDLVERTEPGGDMITAVADGPNRIVYGVEMYCVQGTAYIGVLTRNEDTTNVSISVTTAFGVTPSIYRASGVSTYVTFSAQAPSVAATPVTIRGYRSVGGVAMRTNLTVTAPTHDCAQPPHGSPASPPPTVAQPPADTPPPEVERTEPGGDMITAVADGPNRIVYGVEMYCVQGTAYIGVLTRNEDTTNVSISVTTAFGVTPSIYRAPGVSTYVTFSAQAPSAAATPVTIRGYRSVEGVAMRTNLTVAVPDVSC